ncbi:hypothetical protein AA313_de0203639 [Arthrobotrys entomopaga]|nr:hypothetical protein AA313_de0203639 [Arthrobotrys entomopaga]
MSGAAEAGLVLGIISAIISIVDATKQIYEAVEDSSGLPKNFKQAAIKLPLVSKLLEDAERYVATVDDSTKNAFTPVLEQCKVQATKLQDLFKKVIPEEGGSRWDRYAKAARTIGKGGRVESLIGGILESLSLLATRFPEVTSPRGKDQLATAIDQVTHMEPSLPDDFYQTPSHTYTHYGSGAQIVNASSGSQYNNTGTGNQNFNNGPGHQYIGTNHIVNKTSTSDDDQDCLRALGCPDPLLVRNQLKLKDKLLQKPLEWVLRGPQYINWRDGNDTCLLWIKGGPGKGKTMMTIGLMEQLPLAEDRLGNVRQASATNVLLTYFFCQGTDKRLNTLESIVKGLILRLSKQQDQLMRLLRNRWDAKKGRFKEDLTSWKALWDILLEMLEHWNQKVYLILDGLDECQAESQHMAEFLMFLARTGFQRPSKVKWLLTSRPSDTIERELLASAGPDQTIISLELNSEHISDGVTAYIDSKLEELSHRHKYSTILRQDLQTELITKAEDTYLWVSLICRELDTMRPGDELAAIQPLPKGLDSLYAIRFNQFSSGGLDPKLAENCLRLLKLVILVDQPLRVIEVNGLAGFSGGLTDLETLVNQCSSFITIRDGVVQFVHQSARDHFTKMTEQSVPDSFRDFDHGDIAINSVSHLSRLLRFNFWNFKGFDDDARGLKSDNVGLSYAAIFWVQHLKSAKRTNKIKNATNDGGQVQIFLQSRLLMWVEFLIGLEKLPRAIESLIILENVQKYPHLSRLAKDALEILARHKDTIRRSPLQVYTSAIIFSPQSNLVVKNNKNQLPNWLKQCPQMGNSWWPPPPGETIINNYFNLAFSLETGHIVSMGESPASLMAIFDIHPGRINAIAYSNDGKLVAYGSSDCIVRLWEIEGKLLKSFIGHSRAILAVEFSPDDSLIASISEDKTIRIWNATGNLQKVLTGHRNDICAMSFSPDSQLIASGSRDHTVKLWNIENGIPVSFIGRSAVEDISFSPDGRLLAIAYNDRTIKLWDIRNDLQKEFVPGSSWTQAITILSRPEETPIYESNGAVTKSSRKLTECELEDADPNIYKRPFAFERYVRAMCVAFSLDGLQLASVGADDGVTIILWDVATVEIQKSFNSSHRGVQIQRLKFSPDCELLASTGFINGFNISDQLSLETAGIGPCYPRKDMSCMFDVGKVLISPDGSRIASTTFELSEQSVNLWNAMTGEHERTLFNDASKTKCPLSVIVFSPDSRQIASGLVGGNVGLWDVATGQFLKTFPCDPGLGVVALSPNGQKIGVGYLDNTIKLWDIGTGNLENQLPGHSETITSISYSPDGSLIASGCIDYTIKLWDTASGILRKTLVGDTPPFYIRNVADTLYDGIYKLVFSPDGNFIASSHRDSINLWSVVDALKLSKIPGIFGGSIARHKKFRTRIKISVATFTHTIKTLRFSSNGEYLISDMGGIQVKSIKSNLGHKSGSIDSSELQILNGLNINKSSEWIFYGSARVLRLPENFEATCWDVEGDHLAIGCKDGSVLNFNIDRELLKSSLQSLEHQT